MDCTHRSNDAKHTHTHRADNSSRFGKFIIINYADGTIAGGHTRTFLLEKARLVFQDTGERNFHIFYKLINDCDDDKRAALGLGSAAGAADAFR